MILGIQSKCPLDFKHGQQKSICKIFKDLKIRQNSMREVKYSLWKVNSFRNLKNAEGKDQYDDVKKKLYEKGKEYREEDKEQYE